MRDALFLGVFVRTCRGGNSNRDPDSLPCGTEHRRETGGNHIEQHDTEVLPLELRRIALHCLQHGEHTLLEILVAYQAADVTIPRVGRWPTATAAACSISVLRVSAKHVNVEPSVV